MRWFALPLILVAIDALCMGLHILLDSLWMAHPESPFDRLYPYITLTMSLSFAFGLAAITVCLIGAAVYFWKENA